MIGTPRKEDANRGDVYAHTSEAVRDHASSAADGHQSEHMHYMANRWLFSQPNVERHTFAISSRPSPMYDTKGEISHL